MWKNVDKLPYRKVLRIYLCAGFFLLSACSAYDGETNKQPADIDVEQSEEVPAQPEKTEEQSSVKWVEPGPFSENPQGREQYRAVLQGEAVYYDIYYEEDMTMEQFYCLSA